MNSDLPGFEDELKLAQKDSVAKAFAENPSPDGLADIGIDALDAVENLLKRFYDEEKPDQPLACQAGCTFCCHQYVGISAAELAIVTKYVETNFDAADQLQLRDRLGKTLEATAGMNQFERAASRIDCPLLDETTRHCTIYTARPLTCRGMHSLDREACEKDDATPGQNHPIPQFEDHKSITRSIAIGLHLGIAENDLEAKELELGRALLIALSGKDAIKRWINGEAVFADAVVPEN
ncbi:MAG: YkgJ family cysteine cluster protein [Rhodospirillaceae bacterium]|jgi:Fe-S-cluster containining protein|nr:YkgJ family cysteine cluster protein [Rhodospirillaceae bacterium]MBT7955685.1 YkgJ family cysteine cluster protein [Rhodospirillaceae bacterium]